MRIVRLNELALVPASHEDPSNPPLQKKVMFGKDDLVPGTIQMINWATLAKGTAFTKHRHTSMSEVFIMLTGKVTIAVGDEKAVLHAGDAVLVPSGQDHQMFNNDQIDVTYLTIGIAESTTGGTVVSY